MKDYLCLLRLRDSVGASTVGVLPYCGRMQGKLHWSICFHSMHAWVLETSLYYNKTFLSCRSLMLSSQHSIRPQTLKDMTDTSTLPFQSVSTDHLPFPPYRCPVHTQQSFSVYCESCKKCICHECALWGEVSDCNATLLPLGGLLISVPQHKGHNCKPIEFVFERQKELCKAEVRACVNKFTLMHLRSTQEL